MSAITAKEAVRLAQRIRDDHLNRQRDHAKGDHMATERDREINDYEVIVEILENLPVQLKP